jgi:hypothetical protein
VSRNYTHSVVSIPAALVEQSVSVYMLKLNIGDPPFGVPQRNDLHAATLRNRLTNIAATRTAAADGLRRSFLTKEGNIA